MSRGKFSAGKRRREAEKARKKQEKADRLRRNRENRPTGEIPIATVEDLQGPIREPVLAPSSEDGGEGGDNVRTMPTRLFVGGLSWDTDDADLRTAFEAFGEVTDAVIVTDRDTGRSRGFGFVTMGDRRTAMKAVRGLDGQELDGRTIKVNPATERGR